jgi:hypothetical protein
MFFPNNYPKLQLMGQKIPGHWTVVANDPLWYSRDLSKIGWPTLYTSEKFGVHFEDFGNPETDGHGISMIAHWKTWNKASRPIQWVKERWTYIKEAANFIVWSLDHPELSFTKNGLLYGETEAAMNDYSMYCNIPCYLGLLMYAEMAETLEQNQAAEEWRNRAAGLKAAIEDYFGKNDPVYGDIWVEEPWGGTISFFHDYYGNDVINVLPADWIERYRNSYFKDKDLQTDKYFVSHGIGYKHDAFTQTAMLLDIMEDTTQWFKNLARICYSPRLPNPYIVPECVCVDIKNGIIERQGDLGNGFQQAETINTILICAGIDDSNLNELKIMPRLPKNWDMQINKFPVSITNGENYICDLDISMTYPKKERQSISLKTTSGGTIKNVKLRVGLFKYGTTGVQISINDGAYIAKSCFDSGDSAWAWVDVSDLQPNNKVEISINICA